MTSFKTALPTTSRTKWLLIALLIGALIGCSPNVISDTEGRRGMARDAIFSLEPRQNGAYVMWLRHDSEGVYCINEQAVYDKAQQIMTKGTGWAIVEYHTLRLTELSCKNVESTDKNASHHTIYVVNTITETENQQ